MRRVHAREDGPGLRCRTTVSVALRYARGNLSRVPGKGAALVGCRLQPKRSVIVSIQRSATSPNLHFGHFAAIPRYRQVNQALVRTLFPHLPDPFLHVDLATGTGLVPQLLFEEAQTAGYHGTIVGVDREPRALEIASAGTTHSADIAVVFRHGDVRQLDRLLGELAPPSSVDSLSIHDAIHEIVGEQDQRAVLRVMAKLAKPRGLISLNSSFTSIAMTVENSARRYGQWKLQLIRLMGATRNKTVPRFAYRSPEDYRRMVEEAGFEIIHEAQRVVELTKEDLKAISRYPAGIEGFCADLAFPKALRLDELSEGMIAALETLPYDTLPRVWYELIGRKRSAA